MKYNLAILGGYIAAMLLVGAFLSVVTELT